MTSLSSALQCESREPTGPPRTGLRMLLHQNGRPKHPPMRPSFALELILDIANVAAGIATRAPAKLDSTRRF